MAPTAFNSAAGSGGAGGNGGSDKGDKVELKPKDAPSPQPDSTDEKSEAKPSPLPSSHDVTFEQLVRYPKRSLRAQSYFDIEQIRATKPQRVTKPITLAAMGIGVPDFPELEKIDIVRVATEKGKKQLYHPADVLPSGKRAKPHLQKEIVRRALLQSLHHRGEDAVHGKVPTIDAFRKKDAQRSGLPTTCSACLEWLVDHPPPAEEHQFLRISVRQWLEGMRAHMGRNTNRSMETEAAIREYDAAKDEGLRKTIFHRGGEEKKQQEMTKRSAKGDVAHTPREKGDVAHSHAASRNVAKEAANGSSARTSAANATMNGQMQSAFDGYQSQLAAWNSMRSFAPAQMPPQMHSPNGLAFQSHLAASLNMNSLQSQAIAHYQNQLAAMQMQTTQFEIYVSKDTFKFNASHFVAYPGFRERLHGHSYRASVKLLGSHYIGRDGYVLDFGCVKSVTKDVCKKMNEYFLVPMLSEVLTITVEEDEDGDADTANVCGDCDAEAGKSPKKAKPTKKKRKRSKYPGSVSIKCEDGSFFVFPRQDCLLLPIMHSTAEELAVYLYGKILEKLDADYLQKRGVKAMEVTVSEAVGQDAVFRRAIAGAGNGFDVAAYISKETIPVMPCATETEAAKQRR
ncbi:hypothetical protein ACHAXT_006090 [Thalassiosira profunda]